MSKGSAVRPRSVSQDEWDSRWEAIFQKDVKDDAPQTQPPQYWGESPNIDLRKDPQ
jgi:hypothetical protein